MQVSYCGLCRGHGKIFVALRISSVDDACVVRFRSEGEAVGRLPCDTYEENGLRIAALPVVDFDQALVVEEVDSSGAVRGAFRKKLSARRAKWESRFRYRFDRELVDVIRNYDGTFRFTENHLEFVAAVPDADRFLVRAALVVSGVSSPEDLSITCIGTDGRSVDVGVVRCGGSVVKPVKGSGFSYACIPVSISVPKSLENYCFEIRDAADSSATRFSVLEAWLLGCMLEDFGALTRNAQIDSRYPAWFEKHRADEAVLRVQRETVLESAPVFSIVVPLYKTPRRFFDEMVLSVRAQTYARWELILVNASPEDEELAGAVREASRSDERVKILALEENGGISANSNAGIAVASGDFVSFFDHDDLIEPDLLYEYALAVLERPDTDLLYCDEDKKGEDGRYFDPFFKPDFNLDLLRNNNYICHMLTVRRSVLDQVGLLDPACDGAQDHDLTLRVSECARHIHHVPKILYHWRVSSGSTAGGIEGSKPYATLAGIRAVENHLSRLGLSATVDQARRPATYRVKYRVPEDEPLVSIVIPNKDSLAVLRQCVDSILDKSTYDAYEIVIVENNSTEVETFAYYEEVAKDSRVRCVFFDGPFNFSKIINQGVEAAKGEYCILLNNDTEVITPDWIETMLGLCARQDVGAVGVKLYYPDDTIQHAGIGIAPSVAACLHQSLPRSDAGYFALNDAQQDLSAVTAACMMTKRSAFEQVGGMTEDLAVAFNDLDYCLKLRERDYLVVYTPEVELYHYESLSRGSEDTVEKVTRFLREVAYMNDRWVEYYAAGDPYLNINLSRREPGSYYFRLPDKE